MLIASLAAQAQPSDLDLLFLDPCNMPAPVSMDLTGDGIPEFMITGWSEGTEDVPSSSGYCSRGIAPCHGRDLLIAGGTHGPEGAHAQ